MSLSVRVTQDPRSLPKPKILCRVCGKPYDWNAKVQPPCIPAKPHRRYPPVGTVVRHG